MQNTSAIADPRAAEAALHRVYQYLYRLALEAEAANQRAAALDFAAVLGRAGEPEQEPAREQTA